MNLSADIRVLTGLTVATMATEENALPYGLQKDAAIALKADRIAWVGGRIDLPDDFKSCEMIDMGGRLVTPALIDCHTHLVHAGNRSNEFEMRLNGESYEAIARAGGGILSTVTATRAASEDELGESALPRLDALIAEGVCVVEIKSGYGLTIEDELKMLRAARKLETLRDVRIKTTLLAAHAPPPEYKTNPDDYIAQVCIPVLQQGHAEGLIDSVDAFCERIAFTPTQVARVFDEAKAFGIPVKIHAEQLTNYDGAKMAASRYKALSADHLEYLDGQGIAAMKAAGTVATLLPGAFYYLREEQLPPVQALRAAGVPMALATDCNPGTSPMSSLLLAMNMGCTLFRMTPEETLRGVTVNAAKALGLDDCGTVEPGKRADLAVWDIDTPGELSYRIGFNPLHKRIFGGAL